MPTELVISQEQAYVTPAQLNAYHNAIKDGLVTKIGPIRLSIMVTNWVGTNAPFTQEIAVEGLTSNMENLTLNPINISSSTQRTEYYQAIGCLLPCADVDDGKIILKAHTKPEMDFVMVLKGVEV